MRNPAISKNASVTSGFFALLVRLNIRTSISKIAVLLLPFVFLAILAGCGARHPPPRPAIPGSAAESIVQTALSKTGRPYSRGGTSPRVGFDCSGLVVWVYGKHGVKLPRTARDQSRAGSVVPYNQLQGGDLIFFRIGGRGAYHVGIATGRGTFIHSPRPGQRVREESLFDRYWQQRLIAVRRVL
ncbi:C40 family peptidase [Desulfonatronum thiodismutans]|uniref:C40 family peptidase n=1 Tax=Desulfonatronum thiodismutans TaxID=159290 RepID=UPI0006902F05|nr:C40 family peptidase [Desulfonatronum thiodismutans]